jgi:rhombotail lipoprotein
MTRRRSWILQSTRSLVLRAGGTDARNASTTLIDQRRKARAASVESFAAATDHAIENFDRALSEFEADVRNGKANVRVSARQGRTLSSGGAGSMTWGVLAGALFLLAMKALLAAHSPQLA